ncbi:MAG: anti-sigma regulatory factor [Actinomycetota bacterium]
MLQQGEVLPVPGLFHPRRSSEWPTVRLHHDLRTTPAGWTRSCASSRGWFPLLDDESPPSDETSQEVISIALDDDIATARQAGRRVAEHVGFAGNDLTMISTAISDLARNIIQFAVSGEVVVSPISDGSRVGVMVVARDNGPGIEDLDLAMRDGYTTGSGMGLGLPGARRLMDEFAIASHLGEGTTVVMKKWTQGL